MFKKDLEKDVASDTSGDFKRLLVSCITVRHIHLIVLRFSEQLKGCHFATRYMQCHREPEGAVDQAKAAQDAKVCVQYYVLLL